MMLRFLRVSGWARASPRGDLESSATLGPCLSKSPRGDSRGCSRRVQVSIARVDALFGWLSFAQP
eukprot:212107-Pleurochrysis_carterae.AAC.1